MVCYTFDDYEFWSDPYGIDAYISQFEKLTKKWLKGLDMVCYQDGNANFEEFKRSAEGVYINMLSTLNTAKFAKYKRNISQNKDKLIEVIKSEMLNAEALYKLMAKDAKIGYEVTNHYFANRQRVLEKMVNLTDILEQLKNN